MNKRKVYPIAVSAVVAVGGIAGVGTVAYAQTLSGVTVNNPGAIKANIQITKDWTTSGTDTNKAGDSVNYKIDVTFSGASNEEPVKDFKITVNPKLVYSNYDSMTELQQSEANQQAEELSKEITSSVTQEQGVMTTTSISTIASITVPVSDYGMVLNPNFTISYEQSDGTTTSYTVSNTNLTEDYTNSYTDKVAGYANNTEGRFYFGVYSSTKTAQAGYYNPYNHEVQSLTFKVTNSSSSVSCTPITSLLGDDFKSDGNDTYTISGSYTSEYMDNLQKLFNIKGSDVSVDTLTITPVSIEYVGLPNGYMQGVVNTGYYGTSIQIVVTPSGVSTMIPNTSGITCSQDVSFNQDSYYPQFTYNTNVDVKGNDFKVYSGVAIGYGQAIVTSTGKNLLTSNQVAVSLTSSELQTMLYGTTDSKASLFKEIVDGTAGTSYSYQEVESGTKIKGQINFLYSIGENDVSATFDALGNGSDPIIVKGCTLAYASVPTSDITGFSSYDQEFTNSKGELTGFFLGANSDIGLTQIENSEGPFYNNVGQTSSIRFGDQIQHNMACTDNEPDPSTNAEIDNYTQDVPNESTAWLENPHTVTLTSNQGSMDNVYYQAGDDVVINSSAPMRLSNSTVVIDGTSYDISDYTLTNDNKTLTFKLPTELNANGSLKVTGVYFIAYGNSPIYVNGNFVGSGDNVSGKVIDVNDQEIDYSTYFGGNKVNNSPSVNIALTSNNNCLHYATPTSEGNTTTITDVLHNDSDSACQYLVVGYIPTSNSPTLAGQDGDSPSGGLSSKLMSLTSNGATVWLLPNADYSKYASDLSSSSSSIKEEFGSSGCPGDGWVEYKPGMSLSGYCAYISNVTIPSNSDWDMQYEVQLTNVIKGKLQYATSQFKYYNLTDGVGSVSNIINIIPYGVDITPRWVSSVGYEVNGVDTELTQEQLNEEFSNGESLSYLNSTGADNDENYDNIPQTSSDHLEQEFNMVMNSSLLKEHELQFNGVYINGVYYNAQTSTGLQYIKNWLSSTDLAKDTGVISIKFMISEIPKGTVVVKTVYPNGVVVKGSMSTLTGYENTQASVPSAVIPPNYHLSTTMVDGKIVKSVDVYFDDGAQTVTYNLVRDTGTIVSEFEYPSGTVKTIGTISGDTSTSYNMEEPIAPVGYKISSITVNGKVVNSLSNVDYQDGSQTIIYHLTKLPVYTVSEEMETSSGVIIDADKVVASGYQGEQISYSSLSIPNGYVLDGIEVNGKEVSESELPTYLTNQNINIVYIVSEKVLPVKPTTKPTTKTVPTTKPNTKTIPTTKPTTKTTPKPTTIKPTTKPNITTKPTTKTTQELGKYIITIENTSGQVIGNSVTLTGKVGTELGSISSDVSIPNGYKIQSVTYNGVATTMTRLETEEYTSQPNRIVITVTPVSKVTKSTQQPTTKSTPLSKSTHSGIGGTPTSKPIIKSTPTTKSVTGSTPQSTKSATGSTPQKVKVIPKVSTQQPTTRSATGSTPQPVKVTHTTSTPQSVKVSPNHVVTKPIATNKPVSSEPTSPNHVDTKPITTNNTSNSKSTSTVTNYQPVSGRIVTRHNSSTINPNSTNKEQTKVSKGKYKLPDTGLSNRIVSNIYIVLLGLLGILWFILVALKLKKK